MWGSLRLAPITLGKGRNIASTNVYNISAISTMLVYCKITDTPKTVNVQLNVRYRRPSTQNIQTASRYKMKALRE